MPGLDGSPDSAIWDEPVGKLDFGIFHISQIRREYWYGSRDIVQCGARGVRYKMGASRSRVVLGFFLGGEIYAVNICLLTHHAVFYTSCCRSTGLYVGTWSGFNKSKQLWR